jgi:hypothetical protein
MGDTPVPPAARGPRLLLGIFIVWQIIFLCALNGVEMLSGLRDELPTDKDVPEVLDRAVPGWAKKKGHVHDLSEMLNSVADHWANLTGQTQSWSLFAPNVRRQCVFPAVVLRWDEEPLSAPSLARQLAPLAAGMPLEVAVLGAAGSLPVPAREPETLLSDNEPRDVNSYFRFGKFRLRRYENNIIRILDDDGKETPAATKERWRKAIARHIEKYGDVVKAYLQWRLEGERRRHPERPLAKQVIIVMRRYTIVPPAEGPPYWRGPFSVPLARWQPHVRWQDDHGPLEAYDPNADRFRPTKN